MLTQSVAIVQAITRCKRPRSGRERRLLHAHNSAETCGPRTVLVNNYSIASLSRVTAGKIMTDQVSWKDARRALPARTAPTKRIAREEQHKG